MGAESRVASGQPPLTRPLLCGGISMPTGGVCLLRPPRLATPSHCCLRIQSRLGPRRRHAGLSVPCVNKCKQRGPGHLWPVTAANRCELMS